MPISERQLAGAARDLRIALTYGAFGCDVHMPALVTSQTLRLETEVMARHRLRPYAHHDVNIPLMTDARTGFFAC